MSDKRHLPVQFDGERYFIPEKALDQHIENNLLVLRKSVLAKTDISTKKFAVVTILGLTVTAIVASLAFAGSTFFAFIIAVFAVLEIKPILKFLEGSKDDD